MIILKKIYDEWVETTRTEGTWWTDIASNADFMLTWRASLPSGWQNAAAIVLENAIIDIALYGAGKLIRIAIPIVKY